MSIRDSDPVFRVPRIFSRKKHRAAPGAQPGVVRPAPDALPPSIDIIQFNADEHIRHMDVPVAEVANLISSQLVTWVNVTGLGDAETITSLGHQFGLHGLVQEDIANVHQRAKVEEFDDHLFIVARMVSFEEHLATEQLSMILGRQFVLTFQERPGDCLGPVRSRLKKKQGRLRDAGADYLAYAILDAVIDGYFPVLDMYTQKLDDMEEHMVALKSKHVIARIHRLRSEFYMLRKAVWPHRELFNSLVRDTGNRFDKETLAYLRDCYDHTIQIIDSVDTCREIASDIRDYHFAQVGLRQNEIMKVLTIVSSLFIPLGFIAGLYGMNFEGMPELKWSFGYPLVLTVMGSVASGMMFYFWKRGWLKT